jgi:FAD/FMN-containing dehydrogenase
MDKAEETQEEIRKFFSGEVESDDATLEKYSRDASLFVIRPSLVAFPKNALDVSKLVRYVLAKNRTGAKLSLSARSAGTDMTGGSLTDSVMVEFVRHMNKLISVSEKDNAAVVEPGMFYRDFDKETLKHGLILPSYTASREICTVGGMAANNSGGEKNLLYGKTERYVQKLNVVLDDGSIEEFKALTMEELEAKKKETTRSGEIHRAMHELIERNYELLVKAKPNVSKNSSGYYLWNVIDRERGTFDLTKMVVGSQGTLGIITEITYGLIRPRPYRRMMTIFLTDLSFLGELTNHVLAHKPESFESYDDHTFTLAMRLFPQIAKRLGGNVFTLGLSFLPEFWMMLTGGIPKLVLLAEFSAETEEEAVRLAEEAAKDVSASFKVTARVLHSESEAKKYWVMRRESFSLLRANVIGLRTAPFIDDFVVRPEVLPEFLPKLNAILDKYHLLYTIAGHVGDGNFHIIPLMDLTDPKARETIETLSKEVYELVFSYNGVITGEHNDGIIRTPYLEEEFGPEVYKLFVETKKIFDPNNIFNPGKKVNGTLEYAMEHLDASKPKSSAPK